MKSFPAQKNQIREQALFMAGGAVQMGRGQKFQCKQIEGGGKILVQRRNDRNFFHRNHFCNIFSISSVTDQY